MLANKVFKIIHRFIGNITKNENFIYFKEEIINFDYVTYNCRKILLKPLQKHYKCFYTKQF